MRIARLPAETIDFVVTNNGTAALADDHAARLLNHDTVALTHLATGSAHVIKTPRVILRRRWHEGGLHLYGGRSRWRWRRLQGGGSNRGCSDRPLGCRWFRRLPGGAGNSVLLTWLLCTRGCRWRLRTGRRW